MAKAKTQTKTATKISAKAAPKAPVKAVPAAKSKGTLKWTNTEDIAFLLIDKYPNLNPLGVRFTDLHKYVTELPDFGDDPKKSNEGILESIQMTWYEERQDMEDELGPLSEVKDEDEDLDEDDYRDDKMIDEGETKADSGDEDSDDDEDEFGEGFQEEGEPE